MKQKINWAKFHNQVKNKFILIDKSLWWGDDLDVRFYTLYNLLKYRNRKILDIGCNIGVPLGFLDKSNEIYGIDINKNFINQAKELYPHVKLYVSNMSDLPFKNDSFDIIIMMNVIPYYDFKLDKKIKNKFIVQVFNEINRVLKKDGYIYLTSPNGDNYHYKDRKIKIKELKKILNKNSFKVKIKGWNNVFTNNLKFLSKFFYPKFFYRFNLVWNYLINNMNNNVENSKYFYVEVKKE